MKKHFLTNILNQLSEEGVPHDLDLRAAIHRRLETGNARSKKNGFAFKRNFAQPVRIAVISVTAFLLLTVTFMLTPGGSSWLRNTIHVSVPTQDNGYSLAPAPTQEQSATKSGIPVMIPTLDPSNLNIVYRFATVAEAETATRLDIYQFPFPLPGLKLISVSVVSGSVLIEYQAIQGGSYLTLEQRKRPPAEGNAQIVAQEGSEIVRIGNVEGMYIPPSGPVQMSSSYETRLRWQVGDMWFELAKLGNANIDYLDRVNLIALATSLADPSVRLDLQNGYFVFLNVADARSATGITIAKPSDLPDEASLGTVTVYMPEQLIRSVYGWLGVNSLIIEQTPKNNMNDLVDRLPGPPSYTPISIQIGPYLGNFIEGISVDGKNYKAIWWSGDQNAFMISFVSRPNDSVQLEKTDLIAIAESIH